MVIGVVAAVCVVLLGFAFMLKQPVLAASSPGLGVTIAPDRLRSDVETLVGFSPRGEDHPENLERAAQWVERELSATGVKVETQEVIHGGRTFRNLIASYGPRDGERIIVGAHYDGHEETPGADDNASGLAALLALARLLEQNPPRSRVDLVAYTLEESGLVGSARHAESLRQANVPVRAMFSLEMLGYFSDKPESQRVPLSLIAPLYPSRGDFIAVVGEFHEVGLVREVKSAMMFGDPHLPVQSINAPRFVPAIGRSDHKSFWDHGYPAVMITDTAFLRNPNYHRATDTPDTLDYEKLSRVVRQVYAAVQRLSDR